MEWFESKRLRANKELRTASLELDSDKKNLFVVRGEYNICDEFFEYINNLKSSQERELEKK